MKARILAGLVASLALLTAVSAEAGPKRRHAGGATKPAATVTTPEHASGATKPAATVTTPEHASGATKPAAVIVRRGKHTSGATRPASVLTTPGHAGGATRPASVVTTPEKERQGKPAGRARVSKTPALSRFIASGIPLAEVRDGRLKAVGNANHPCGTKAHWAKKGSGWTALDAFGQIAGTLTISGSDSYDGTGCHQVSFAEGTGKDGLGVFVAKGSGYTPAPSARWNPASDVTKRFEHLYSTQASAWVDGKSDATADHGKMLFFQLPKQEGSVEGSPTLRRPIHWAVSGGRVLVVAYVGATGAWKVGHVLAPNGKDHAYEPLAVLDMNGDGLPEIVVHEEAGGVFTDRVLSFDAGTMRWEKAVESPGGATP